MAAGQGNGSMSLSMKFIRLIIVLFNVAFVILGAILLAVGIYVIRDPKMKQLRPLLNPEITTTYSQQFSNLEVFALVITVIGGVLLIIGFLGCCGAIKGFRCLHLLYAVILGVIIAVEIAIVVAFFTYQNQFRNELVGKLQDSIQTYYVGPPIDNTTVNSVSLAWDFTQFNLDCCGAIGQNDFLLASNWSRVNPYQSNATLTVPFTCCRLGGHKSWTDLPTNMSLASKCATTGDTAYKKGCYDSLMDVIATYKKYFIIVGVIVGVVEMLAFIIALLLYCRKTEEYDSL